MRKIFSAFILLGLVSTTMPAQTVSNSPRDLKEWNEFYDLQWHDFQGKRTEDAIGDAGTVVQIKAKPYMLKKKIRYDVYAYFSRKKSWAVDTSNALLRHERLHFDIAEVYARKIRKKIQELSDRNVNDVKVYNAAIQELLEESNDADRLYDIQTLHGSLPKRQAEWTRKVRQELLDLKKYKRQKQVISAG
jgi:predicted secreted Zn-dependent protease